MSFGSEIILTEDVEPNEPWLEWDARFFDSIRFALRSIEDGKRKLDSERNKETGESKEIFRGKKRRKDSHRKA